MNPLRLASDPEKAVISALLALKPETAQLTDTLHGLLVAEMSDGGMGSLSLVPNGLAGAQRGFGRQVVMGEFADSDGVPVSVALNVDNQGYLYELDVWKVDFSQLMRWPDPTEIRMQSGT